LWVPCGLRNAFYAAFAQSARCWLLSNGDEVRSER
jgi:hypothetical protein